MNTLANLLRNSVEFRLPLDLLSALAGGVIGFLLVFVVDWIKKPRIRVLGFEKVSVNFGTLYKLKFRIGGFDCPGICQLRIEWADKSTYAKWDETPNPLENDRLDSFRPELVPFTYNNLLFHGVEYAVPLVYEDGGSREVFSGWWFGKKRGYGPNPCLPRGFNLKLTMFGGGLSWSRTYSESEICPQ